MNFIPVNTPFLGGNERKYLLECIDSGWISSEGPFVEKFEQAFAARMGRKFGIAVSNGSFAIDAAIAALEIAPGSEVILPSFTIISCASAVVRAGCIPVAVDCDPLTWNMRVEDIESKISSLTSAILVVHIYGLPVDIDPILNLAKRRNLAVIEDAAEMHGQTYNGKPCGSLGDISTFSFYPNKHVTTGEGGMVLTDDENLAERCRSLRNLCFQPSRRFVHEELGWNLRMTNMQAAIGLAQLEQLDKFVERKRSLGSLYRSLLSGDCRLGLQPEKTDYADNIYWVFGIVLSDELPFDADFVIHELEKRGIGSRPFFWPMHEQPVLNKMGLLNGLNLPVSERIARRGFYLPSGLGTTNEQIEKSALALREILA